MRNRVVGSLNILFSTIELFLQLSTFLTRSKLDDLYTTMHAELPLITRVVPFISGLIIALMMYFIFIGIKLVTDKTENQKLFKKGIIGLCVTAAVFVFLTGFTMLSVVFPIYNLTNNY